MRVNLYLLDRSLFQIYGKLSKRNFTYNAFIPVICRAMMRNERHFKEPYKFDPDRFLVRPENPESDSVHPLSTFKPDDPRSLCFGFGRR